MYSRILVPIDGSEAAECGLREAMVLFVRAGEAMVAKAVKTVAEAGVDHESVVVDAGAGSAWEAIVEQVARSHCDLVVMGTHGRRGLKRLTMGSDAELVVRHATVPVLLVKASAKAA